MKFHAPEQVLNDGQYVGWIQNVTFYVPVAGWGNGYLYIPGSVPEFSLVCELADVDELAIHGGVTYAGSAPPWMDDLTRMVLEHEQSGGLTGLCVGFDTGHVHDCLGSQNREYILNEVLHLYRQCLALRTKNA